MYLGRGVSLPVPTSATLIGMSKHIIAASGGFIYPSHSNLLQSAFGPIVRYGLELTGKPRPKLCYIGTATGDSAIGIASFYGACAGEDVEPSHVQLFTMPNVRDVRKHILSQDMIWVQGGSVANLLAVWKVHGLDEILREAWESGIVLGGISAGSICWHVGGTTDSFGQKLQPVTNGLALIPYSNGVHYNKEEERRPLFHELIGNGTLPEGYATDEGVALHYVDDVLKEAITDIEGGSAYHVYVDDDRVVEDKIEARLLS